jgi:hypothetical protein
LLDFIESLSFYWVEQKAALLSINDVSMTRVGFLSICKRYKQDFDEIRRDRT